MHTCGMQACASLDAHTLLQKSASLLLPVEHHDSLILGYFVESLSDHAMTNLPRVGRYVYCANSHQIITVSRVHGPLSAANLSSVCINRVALFGNAMFIKDCVMASFPWHEQASITQPPAQYIVHSRTLSFYKLIQTAQSAGIAGHIDSIADVSPGLDASDEYTILENSFFGIGAFGAYEATLVPCKAPPNVQTDSGADNVPLASGKWAVPEHWTVCGGRQLFHLGLFQKEASTLRAQFVQAFSNVNGNIGRPLSVLQEHASPATQEPQAKSATDEPQLPHASQTPQGPQVSQAPQTPQAPLVRHVAQAPQVPQAPQPQAQHAISSFADNSPVYVVREDAPRGDGGLNEGEVETRGDEGIAYIGTGVDYVAKESNVGFDGSGPGASMTVRTASSTPQIPGNAQVGHIDGSGGGDAGSRVEVLSEKEVTAESDPIGAVALGDDASKVAAMSSAMGMQAQGFQSSVDDMLNDVPASMVESIEGVVSVVDADVVGRAGNVGFTSTGSVPGFGETEKDVKTCTTGVTEAIAGTKITGNGSSPQKATMTTGGSSSTKEEEKVVGKPFKKTLPAPTKSEIVIRNRISAQRSNEKRRRKIEATKSELAYLKVTYLPQLEHRRGSLLSENQTLRLQFMEKYNEGEISSFF